MSALAPKPSILVDAAAFDVISLREITGTGGPDTLTGGAAADQIYGFGGNDLLSGRGGNDEIYGGDGNDRILGEGGNDDLEGGRGNDAVFGGQGADQVYGGAGNDWLSGGAGNDEMTGGAGADTFVFTAGRDAIDILGQDDILRIGVNSAVDTRAELLAVARTVDGGDSLLIDFGGGNTLLLENTSRATLQAVEIVFV